MRRKEFALRSAIAALLAGAAALAVFYFRELAQTLLMLFTALLFAAVLDGFARAVKRRLPIPRSVSVISTAVLLALATGLMIWWIGPPITAQLTGLAERIPEIVRDAGEWLETRPWGEAIVGAIESSSNGMAPTLGQVMGGVSGVFSTVLAAVGNVVVLLFVALYLAWDPDLYRDVLLRLFPEGDPRERAGVVMSRVAGALRSWMIGRLASMTVVGVLTGVALAIAGIPLALALGLIAGLFSFVPFLGPIASSVPALLIAFGEGGNAVLVVGAIYIGVQAVESHAITPLIQHRAVSMPPALLISAQVVMTVLFGVIGTLIATPLAVVITVLVQSLYLEDALGQSVEPIGNG